jgi:N-acetylglutamate synthase-like GNAT family acetyltransferase
MGDVVIRPVEPADVPLVRDFLQRVDLTLAGLDAPAVRLWIELDDGGQIVGSTGLERSGDGEHALIRSVAVAPGRRTRGDGTSLARLALDEARNAAVRRA